MDNRIHDALEPIHATEQMKQHTRDALRQAYAQKQPKRKTTLRYLAACCAMFLFVFCGVGGYRLYATPVSYISVDVNPSVELGLNRLDWVVTADAYNDDGALVLQDLRLKNKPYTEAIELLLADETFGDYLGGDALLSFTVVSEKEEELLTGIRNCHGFPEANAECHSANAGTVADAHHNGLSFGKYQAYLELAQYDSTVTPEECQSLTMRQIRDRISQYQGAPATGNGQGNGNGWGGGNGQGNGHHGQSHGRGYQGGR